MIGRHWKIMTKKHLLFELPEKEVVQKKTSKAKIYSESQWVKWQCDETFIYFLSKMETDKIFKFKRQHRKGIMYYTICKRSSYSPMSYLEDVSFEDMWSIVMYYLENDFIVFNGYFRRLVKDRIDRENTLLDKIYIRARV